MRSRIEELFFSGELGFFSDEVWDTVGTVAGAVVATAAQGSMMAIAARGASS